jgi:hypothetical protein
MRGIMSEDRGSRGTVDQGAEQRRYPRVPETHRLFMIHGTERFQAETVDLSKSGMLAACPVIPPSLDKGSEVLFELVWGSEPEANTFIKGTVVRVIRDSDYDNVLLGVEFNEALARAPEALRSFVEKVLGIEHGAVRVVRDKQGRKSLVFDFNPVHQEGAERLRALQSALFSSVDDLEEADRLLEGFGTGESLFAAESTGPLRTDDAPTVQTAAATKVARKAPGKKPTARAPAVKVEPAAPAKVAPPAPAKVAPPAPAKVTPPAPPPTAEAGKAAPAPASKAKPSFFKSLIPSFGKSEKGGALIEPELVRASVANIEGLDIQYDLDGKKHRARAVRLYCAGIKCEVDHGLPELYRSVTLLIPALDGKKSMVVLNGDITRVRPDPDSNESGIFEVRLSLRNETGMLNSYRNLVDQLSIGESNSRAPNG